MMLSVCLNMYEISYVLHFFEDKTVFCGTHVMDHYLFLLILRETILNKIYPFQIEQKIANFIWNTHKSCLK